MTDALTALEEISRGLSSLLELLGESRAKTIGADRVQPSARQIATRYFETVRPTLASVQARAGLVEEIDYVMQALLELATSTREKQAYRGQITELRPYLLEATVELMKQQGTSRLV